MSVTKRVRSKCRDGLSSYRVAPTRDIKAHIGCFLLRPPPASFLAPLSCGQLFASGQCGCQGYDLTQGDDYETIYNRLDLIDELIGSASSDVKRQVVEIICSSTVNDGDHLQVR